ncbi:hypothetical protein ACWGB8_06150 [Kitasatospora sp. NPDC054939]
MPDRDSAPRGRRHSSPQPNGSRQSGTPRSGHRPDRADDLGYEGADRGRGPAQRQLGIPRILGRRARWVGARLRREI